MEEYLYHYKALVTDVYDGDTITVDLDMGRNIWEHDVKLRLLGINAPEIRTKDLEEKERGFLSKGFLTSLILGKTVIVRTRKAGADEDSFGRMLADVYVDGEHVNTKMLVHGHATPYMTGK